MFSVPSSTHVGYAEWKLSGAVRDEIDLERTGTTLLLRHKDAVSRIETGKLAMVTKTAVPATRTRTRKVADRLTPESSVKLRVKKTAISAGDQRLLEKAQQQRELLERAMEAFESIAPSRERFAELIGVSKRGLDKWLYPYMPGKPKSEQDCREMPEPVRRLLIIMLEQRSAERLVQRLAREHHDAVQEKPVAARKSTGRRSKA